MSHWPAALQATAAGGANLHGGLEGQLELGAGDDDVGEVQQVDLQGVQHALA
jgi:hypothetical protein